MRGVKPVRRMALGGPLLFLLLGACQGGGGKPSANYPEMDVRESKRLVGNAEALSPAPQSKLAPYEKLAVLRQGSLGPRLERTGKGWVSVWATSEGEPHGWYSAAISEEGEISRPLWLAELAPGVRQFELGPFGNGGIGVAAVRPGGNHEILEVMRLGDEGALRSAPQLVVDAHSSILWTEIVPTPQGALIVWAERVGNSADIYSAAWSPTGISAPVRSARGAFSWQLVERDGSVSLATLEDDARRRVVLRQLGAGGQVIGAPIQLAQGVSGALDLDMAMSDKHILVAWSQDGRFERAIYWSLLDASGNVVRAAAPLTAPRGGQALVHLAASPDAERFFAIWEEPMKSSHAGRGLFLGDWTPNDALLEPKVRLSGEGQDALLPLLVATGGESFALLAEGPLCAPGPDCDSTDVDFLTSLAPRLSEATSAEVLQNGMAASAASMAWDLSCRDDQCFGLVADSEQPAQVYLFPVPEKGSVASPLVPLSERKGARAVAHQTLSEIPELAAMAGVPTGQGTLVSWLSYFDPQEPYRVPATLAPDGRRAPVRALLQNQWVSGSANQGELLENVISYRARSLGGVQLAHQPGKGSLMVWAALDAKTPQLFATLVDAKGKKVRQKMLTRMAGEVTDVSVVVGESGYVVAWVDSTGGKPEIWSLLVDEQLKAGKPVQLSHGARSPTSLSLARVGKDIVAFWSDSRGASAGHGDLYSIRIDPATGLARGQEFRAHQTQKHSHSVRLVTGKNGVTLFWLESEPNSNQQTAESHVHYAEYQSDHSLGEAKRLEGLPPVVAFSADCSLDVCRLLLAAQEKTASLWTAELAGEAPQAATLLPLKSLSAHAITPLLLGTTGFYADSDAQGNKWFLNRVELDWGSQP